MTDERMGDALLPAIAALPAGAGVIFRHYATPPAERRALFARVARIARRRRLTLIRAGATGLGRGEDGVHGRAATRGIRTWPAHSRREAIAGARAGADLLFVSPLYATRSHAAKRPLGLRRARAIVRGVGVPAIALGGMTSARGGAAMRSGFYGWAAIDAWLAEAGPT
ncbi:thiamine phosphate synthase [Sphingomonas koreensis]|nr:thiamine phosphate synthase [Sphingomonas koreensis]